MEIFFPIFCYIVFIVWCATPARLERVIMLSGLYRYFTSQIDIQNKMVYFSLPSLLMNVTSKLPRIDKLVFSCKAFILLLSNYFLLRLCFDFVLWLLLRYFASWEHTYVRCEYRVDRALSFPNIWLGTFFVKQVVVSRLYRVQTRCRSWQIADLWREKLLPR